MTDQQALLQYARRQDADAFRFLVEQYQRLVYSAARRRLAHPHDIEDVVQLTFLKLAKAAGTIQKDVAAWLYSTAVNTANELIRRDQTRLRHETLWREHAGQQGLAPAPQTSPDELEQQEWHKLTLHVDQAILQLPPDEQSLIIEHFFQNHSQRDLAARLHTSQRTIQRRLQSAVDALRQILHAQGYGAPALLPVALQQLSIPVPGSLTVQLTKLGLAGTGAAAPATVSTAGLFAGLSATAKALLATAAALVLVGGGLAARTLLAPAAPPTPALPASAPAPQETILAKGDTVDITIAGLVTGQNFRAAREISDTGDISLPNYDPIHAAGLTPTQVEQSITKAAVDRGFVPPPLPKEANSPGPQITVRLRPSTPISRLGKIYALADGQNLRRFGPPFPPDRALVAESLASGMSKAKDLNLGFRWIDGNLQTTYSSLSQNVENIFDHSLYIPWYQLQNIAQIPGNWPPEISDWVIRSPLSMQERLDALAKIISADTGRPVRFDKQIVRRPCIILKGLVRELPRADPRLLPVVAVSLDPVDDSQLQAWSTARRPPPNNYDFYVEPSFQRIAKRLDAPFFPDVAYQDHYMFYLVASAELPHNPDYPGLQRTDPQFKQKLQKILTNVQSQIGGTWSLDDRDIETWQPVLDQPPKGTTNPSIGN